MQFQGKSNSHRVCISLLYCWLALSFIVYCAISALCAFQCIYIQKSYCLCFYIHLYIVFYTTEALLLTRVSSLRCAFKHSNCTGHMHSYRMKNMTLNTNIVLSIFRNRIFLRIFLLLLLRWYRQWHRHLYNERSKYNGKCANARASKNLYVRVVVVVYCWLYVVVEMMKQYDGIRSLLYLLYPCQCLCSFHVFSLSLCIFDVHELCIQILYFTNSTIFIWSETKILIYFHSRWNVLANWRNEWALMTNILNWFEEYSSLSTLIAVCVRQHFH